MTIENSALVRDADGWRHSDLVRIPPGRPHEHDPRLGPLYLKLSRVTLALIDTAQYNPRDYLDPVSAKRVNQQSPGLILVQRPQPGHESELRTMFVGKGGEFVLGRDTPTPFNLDTGVSRRHLAVRAGANGDKVTIKDLGSTNGTFVGRLLSREHGRVEVLRATSGGSSLASERHPEWNEDAWFADDRNQAYGVFDGLGGHAGSGEASQIAKSVVSDTLKLIAQNIRPAEAESLLRDALTKAHNAIREMGAKGIGTTAAIGKILANERGDRKLVVAHAGDSRVYLLRGGRLYMLTLDHGHFNDRAPEDRHTIQRALSSVADNSSAQQLPSSLRAAYRYRNEISSSLGTGPLVIETNTYGVLPGDRVLFMTDGVHDNLTTEEINRIVSGAGDDKKVASELTWWSRVRSQQTGHLRAKPDDTTAVIVSI